MCVVIFFILKYSQIAITEFNYISHPFQDELEYYRQLKQRFMYFLANCRLLVAFSVLSTVLLC